MMTYAECYILASTLQDDSSDMGVLYVRVPQTWLSRLRVIAEDRSVSVSALVRIVLREFLYPKREAA